MNQIHLKDKAYQNRYKKRAQYAGNSEDEAEASGLNNKRFHIQSHNLEKIMLFL